MFNYFAELNKVQTYKFIFNVNWTYTYNLLRVVCERVILSLAHRCRVSPMRTLVGPSVQSLTNSPCRSRVVIQFPKGAVTSGLVEVTV